MNDETAAGAVVCFFTKISTSMASEQKRLQNEAKSRQPDTHYFNMYEGDALVVSYAYKSKKLAECAKKRFDEEVASMVRNGMKLREEITSRVEAAVAWRCGAEKFSTFWEALLYHWTKGQNDQITGVFNHNS